MPSKINQEQDNKVDMREKEALQLQEKIKNNYLLNDLTKGQAYNLGRRGFFEVKNFEQLTKKEMLAIPSINYIALDKLMDKGIVFKEPEKKAWVISVKCGTGCYRHLQVSQEATLKDLADAIIKSFDFDNDHAHAFFMDNKAWSHGNAYFMEEVSDDRPSRFTSNVKLNILHIKQKFLFLFDFGDEWRFSCQVLREVSDNRHEPYELKRVGESPEQYPDHDDWDLLW